MSAKTLTPEQDAGKRLAAAHARICPPETDADRLRRYARDPIGFCREWLGFEPTRVQRTILEAILRGRRVSVRSGRRVGKSYILAAVALWFYCTQGPDTRVILMATTEDQIKRVMWRAVRMLVRASKRPIPGAMGDKEGFDSGLTWDEQFCQIFGATARKKETVAGIAGARLMYIVDEASGVDDQIFDAIEGNLAGGNAWIVTIGNPQRNEGYFFSCHHEFSEERLGPEHGTIALAMSSYESPNVTGECGEEFIPGLATPKWIEGMLLQWGADSAWVSINIKGEFAKTEERKLFSLARIAEAQARGRTQPGDSDYVLPEGRLFIGLDPAGEGGEGDESAFAWRRGKRMYDPMRHKGLSPEGHLVHVLGIISTHRAPIDAKMRPAVVIDVAGGVGKKVAEAFYAHLEKHPDAFEVVRTEGRWKPQREPRIYADFRTELAANASEWLRDGGAIPEDAKLQLDLRALEYDPKMKYDAEMHTERLVLIKKDGPDGVRDRLGRSPDTGDAFQLCCWEPRRLREETNESAPKPPPPANFDPYANNSRAGSAGAVFNPYGSLGRRGSSEE